MADELRLTFGGLYDGECHECGFKVIGYMPNGGGFIKFGSTVFSGCPNCFGAALSRVLGTLQFGNWVETKRNP
jgi:hypothetical protein